MYRLFIFSNLENLKTLKRAMRLNLIRNHLFRTFADVFQAHILKTSQRQSHQQTLKFTFFDWLSSNSLRENNYFPFQDWHIIETGRARGIFIEIKKKRRIKNLSDQRSMIGSLLSNSEKS